MTSKEAKILARMEIAENRYHSNLMDQCLKACNGSEHVAHEMYIVKRAFEMTNEGHVSGEKELKPMLMPLLIIYSIGIILTGWLVYHFVSQ